MQKEGLRTWVEIDKKAIRHNYQAFRSQIGKKCSLMSVVKSNAYGHSLLDFSKEIEKLGIDWLGVDSIVEGEALRKEKISSKILVLGHTLPEKIPSAIENNLSLTISNLENLKNITRFKMAGKLHIHLKIDTGMHRQGFFIQDLKKAISLLKKNKDFIEVEGIYTHFAAAKNPSFPKDTRKQLTEFEKAVTLVRSAGFNPFRHAAATSGTLLFPETHLDMVRVGIGLYGLWPSKETQAAMKNKIKLDPVLSWKTRVSEIKNLKNGERLGYDFTESVHRDSKIAILPIGYWHGYPRSLSSVGHVTIRDKACKILGRVAMDMIVVDVTKIGNIKPGESVTLIGEDLPADYLADLAGTVNYEIVTRINPLIKRIFV
jgi:alanine racemase